MLNHLLFVIQTDAQAKEGFIIVVILFTLFGIGFIYVSISDSQQKRSLMNKLIKGTVTWDDYYNALNNKFESEAYQIKKFLDKRDTNEKREVAEEMSQNKRWENSDYNVKSALNKIENETHRCNKCFSDYF